MGHIGEERILGNDCQIGLVQGVFQQLFLFHFTADFHVYTAVAHDNLCDFVNFPDVYNAQLQVLQLFVLNDAVIDIICFFLG